MALDSSLLNIWIVVSKWIGEASLRMVCRMNYVTRVYEPGFQPDINK